MVGKKREKADARVLKKDRIITREYAEKELVEKTPPKLSKTGGKRRRVEEIVAVEEEVAVFVGDSAVDDGEEGLSVSASVSAMSEMLEIADDLDPDLPLDAIIADNDPGGFGFFDTFPVASSSRVRL